MSSEERERAKASSDGIHCSISEVVVAVIVEDRLLCFPLHLSLPFTVHRTVYTNHPTPQDLAAARLLLPTLFLGSIRHSVGSHRLALSPQSVSDRASVRIVLYLSVVCKPCGGNLHPLRSKD